MLQSLLLPWFPILLGVGVGGRLLGRARGFGLGLICALFWIALVQATQGFAVWNDVWTALTLTVGAFAIVMIGGWAGETDQPGTADRPSHSEAMLHSTDAGIVVDTGSRTDRYDRIRAAIERFQDWLESHRGLSDPWPDFGEFLRAALYECCQATHVKPYRLLPDAQELQLLRATDPFREVERVPARSGILGHVITTGRSFVSGDAMQGELLDRLADETQFPASWCFAVAGGPQRFGAVSIGRHALDPALDRSLMHTVEQLVALFWIHLQEVVHGRIAGDDDPVSHLLNREAFFASAEQSLRDCYDQGEPAALAVVTLHGMRQLNDSGRWELSDELIRDVGGLLRRKVRVDDRVGRFDGSRFIWLLKCVDSDLARLIVGQLMDQLKQIVREREEDASRAGAAIGVCCGLTGAGLDKPNLRTLVARALAQGQRARTENVAVATDLDTRRPWACARARSNSPIGDAAPKRTATAGKAGLNPPTAAGEARP